MIPAVAALAAALAGFAEMSLELAAVRLFAPHFGDSAPVWTNVIGVMLAAMALGAWLGGRLADPARCRVRLRAILLGAGLLAALAPLLAGHVGALLVPDDLPLDAAMGTLVGGSLVATLALFAPPVLLAGTVTPLLVTAVAAGGQPVGRASGLIACWSIVGGLAGTFATTHLLVPGVGSRATVWIAAGALLAAGLVCLPSRRGIAAAAVVLLGGVGAVAGSGGPGPLGALRAGERLVAERETAYQYLQVVDRPRANDQPPLRVLRINEGLDSFHSARIPGTPWTDGRYYDWHVVAPWLAGDGARPPDLRVLSLGAAAGTFERIYRHAHPGAAIDSVEIDPGVVELGRRHFGAFSTNDANRVFAGVDARVFVECADARWDVVLVDAYERQIYVPAHVASVEFFGAVHARLRDGGVVTVNVGGLAYDDPVVRTIATTMAEVFGGEARVLRVPDSRNFVVAARKRLALDPEVLRAVRVSGDRTLQTILDVTSEPARWRRVPAGTGRVLTDDRPFLDALQERSYAGRAEATPLAMRGDTPAAALTQPVQDAAAVADWDRVLELCRTATAESAWLRLMAGDARWRRGDFLGARAEYRRGRELATDGELAPFLAERLREVAAPATALERAHASARRNGLLAALLAAVLGAGVWLLALRRT